MHVAHTPPETPEAASPASSSHFPGTFWHLPAPLWWAAGPQEPSVARCSSLGLAARETRDGPALPSPTCLPPKDGSTWTPLEGRP